MSVLWRHESTASSLLLPNSALSKNLELKNGIIRLFNPLTPGIEEQQGGSGRALGTARAPTGCCRRRTHDGECDHGITELSCQTTHNGSSGAAKPLQKRPYIFCPTVETPTFDFPRAFQALASQAERVVGHKTAVPLITRMVSVIALIVPESHHAFAGFVHPRSAWKEIATRCRSSIQGSHMRTQPEYKLLLNDAKVRLRWCETEVDGETVIYDEMNINDCLGNSTTIAIFKQNSQLTATTIVPEIQFAAVAYGASATTKDGPHDLSKRERERLLAIYKFFPERRFDMK
jgi:hypothetical protein